MDGPGHYLSTGSGFLLQAMPSAPPPFFLGPEGCAFSLAFPHGYRACCAAPPSAASGPFERAVVGLSNTVRPLLQRSCGAENAGFEADASFSSADAASSFSKQSSGRRPLAPFPPQIQSQVSSSRASTCGARRSQVCPGAFEPRGSQPAMWAKRKWLRNVR